MKINPQKSYSIKSKNINSSNSVNIRNKQKLTESKTSNNTTNYIKDDNPNDLILEKINKTNINNNHSRNNDKKLQFIPLTYYEENHYFNLLKQENDKLSKYLNDNPQANIKLIGNEKYKYIPLQKINLTDDKMGLIPIQLRNVKRKSKFEELYEIQRGLARLRRIQYDKIRRNDDKKNFLDNVIMIQFWWKKILFKKKTIKIQKCFRLYQQKKKIVKINSLIKVLNHLCYNKYFTYLKNISYIIKPISIKKYFIAKSLLILSSKIKEKIITIQKNYRIFKRKQLENKLLYGLKYKLNNKKSFFFTKINFNGNELEERNKIQLLQKNIKLFLKKNSYETQNYIVKEIHGNYTDKIYINKIYINSIKFIEKIKHAMKLIIFDKIKENNIKLKEYYFNSIIKIQQFYRFHYKKNQIDSSEIIKINSNKNNICFISIKRIKKNNKQILLIQKRLKLFFKKYLEGNNIIKNKPKSISFMSNNSFNNIFNSSYISKKYIINNVSKIIQLQNQIRKYIYYKKAKEEYYNPKNIKFINKYYINKTFIITKEKKKQKEKIDKLKLIQKYYKNRFIYLKNNILNLSPQKKSQININSKIPNNINNKNINGIKEHYKIIKGNINLNSLLKQNKKPICLKGFYYDKIRVNNNSFRQSYFIPHILNKGTYISKCRIRNNIKKIEKIQNIFRKIKNEETKRDNIPIIKKPQIEIYELVNYNKKSLKKKAKTINEPQIYNDFIGEKIYAVYNKQFLSHMCHININNFYYISKIRKINDNIEINSEREYESILNEIETRKNNSLKNNNEEESNFLLSEIFSEANKNKEKNNEINSIPLNINNNKYEQFEVDKEHLTFREINSKNESILKLINKICYIEKIRLRNNNIIDNIKVNYKKNLNKNEISFDKKYINNILKKNLNNRDENINIIRGMNLLSDIPIKSSQTNTDYNKINNKENSKYSEIIINGNNIIHIQKEKSFEDEKRTHLNININKKINYFKNKTNYIHFFRLLQLFLVKNIQEYIFYKIKGNNKIKEKIQFKYDIKYEFDFPFYIKALYKCYIYYKNKNDEKFKKFFREIFPLIDKDKSFYYNLIYLSSQNKKKLIRTNLFNIFTEKDDLIQFILSFINFDKHISNKTSLINIINDWTFHNTNIFTLIRLIEKNFDNNILNKQNYNIQKAKNNSQFIDDINSYSSNGSDIELLDFEINDIDIPRKTDINFFIYEKK